MSVLDTISGAIIDHRRITIVVLVLTMAAVGSGLASLEEESSLPEFEVGSEEEEKLAYVGSNFSTEHDDVTITQVVVRDDNVLDKETLLATLGLQKDIRTNETIAPTLSDDQPTVGIANVIARAAIRFQQPGVTSPTIDQQMAQLESMDQSQIDAVATRILDDDAGPNSDAFVFMPNDYESGSTTASSTMVVVFQSTDREIPMGQAPERVVESQTEMANLASSVDASKEILVVGNGIISDEMEQSRKDTFLIVGPIALLFVMVTLVLAYRDLLDIVLSLVGIVLVQVWTFGTLGLVGIPFNPVLIAIPVLLIGLSIDYGIHVFMRYREARTATGDGVGTSMKASLAGVGGALVLVTVTTVVGFLSNLASPLGPIRDLGLISAIGIVGALVVFGTLIPALKVELDSLLERFGIDRQQRPIGTDGGWVARLLSVGSTAARRAPVAIVVITLLLTAVTAFGAAQVSTSFEPEDNLAGEAPAWAETLPEPFAPGEYTAKKNLHYTNDRFVRHDSQVQILVEGDVTEPDTLEKVAAAKAEAANQAVVVVLSNGEPQTVSPLTVMDRVAARNESFNETYVAADTDGDGIPDENLERVYDELYAAAPERADGVLHRQDGEYEALRMAVSVNPEADGGETVDQMGTVTGVLDGDGRTATATGQPIINQLVQDHLLETLVTSFLITILVVVAILMLVYRVAHGSATLGLVTALPVVFCVSWIVGTMYALGLPLSVLTTIVASLTIGIGIDYSIHVSERFRTELADAGTAGEAIATTIQGTGSALLGSAATTAVGFGVLAFALLPMLQQFGTITALMIVYAFLGSVLVLPSLLVLWARYLGPEPSSNIERDSGPLTSEAGGD
jgi:predicted RND superfamily exporter protein